jgi:hypothetical protein
LGGSQSQRGEDQAHATLLRRLAGHAVAGRKITKNVLVRQGGRKEREADTRITMSAAIDTIADRAAVENIRTAISGIADWPGQKTDIG